VLQTHQLLHSSKSVEWYTPSLFIHAAQQVMGCIDTDPASSILANTIVGAKTYYTPERGENGLILPWTGKVFLNPPYGRTSGKSSQETWTAELVARDERGWIEEAILLVNAATGTLWFQPLWHYPICFVKGRIKFWTPTGVGVQPTHDSIFAYIGPNALRFAQVFRQFGEIKLPDHLLQRRYRC
jgi:hypothetical protein